LNKPVCILELSALLTEDSPHPKPAHQPYTEVQTFPLSCKITTQPWGTPGTSGEEETHQPPNTSATRKGATTSASTATEMSFYFIAFSEMETPFRKGRIAYFLLPLEQTQ
jgi:hypothetical protein